jgi:hypothetical protein
VLFWIDDRGKVFFAPFDPESGNLHAVPSPVSMGGRPGQGPSPEGGGDVPIILVYCDASAVVEPCVPLPPPGGGTIRTGPPPRIGPEGGNDSPITLTTSATQTTSLAVASQPVCGSQVLAVASEDSVSVLAFDGAGRSTSLGQFRLGPNVDRNAAAATLGAYFLRAACR